MTAPTRTRRSASNTIIIAALTILIIAGARCHPPVAPSAGQLTLPADLPRADESGRVSINEINMWYAIFNKGGSDPVLLIHGGLGSVIVEGEHDEFTSVHIRKSSLASSQVPNS